MIQKILFALIFVIPTLLVQAQGLAADDIARLQMVNSADISQDGQMVAYTLMVPADPYQENKPASYHLYLYNAKTKQALPFFTRGSVRGAVFRPGRQSVTFLAKMDGDDVTSLYEVSLSGGEAQKVYAYETSISQYHWSADGKKLAFIASEPKEKEEAEGKLPYEPILYEQDLTYSRAYIMEWDKKEPTAIGIAGDFHDIQWNPDGQRLAVAVAPTPLIDDYYMKQRVFIFRADMPEKLLPVEHNGKLGKLAWSPDGNELGFLAGADIHDPTDGRLFVVSAQGGKPKLLAPSFEGLFDDFEWIDNTTIQFIASEGLSSILGTIGVDGGALKRMSNAGGLNFTGFGRASDGNLVLTANTALFPDEAFLLPSDMEEPQRITNSNPWLADKKLGRQEAVAYKARDGLELQGILIHPLNEEKGKAYPLITVVHGGPESHYDNGWLTYYSTVGQMAAAEGYRVFYPNYRGSTGRGLEFAMSSQGDLAGKEFDDIVDGVDYLVDEGLADKDKVGVTGGSYGGYATGWMATRYTEKFAAGVMFVGISDNISKWGTSDIPEELFLVHARKRVWDDYEFFLKRSPIYYAGQCETPLLIMAGAEDTRVDPSQSMELYRHIKTRTDTPVGLVLYPGEGHGNRNASARLDYTRRQMGWFNKYLKEEEARP
ncbi:MAG: S9 family peptidase [Lewinellaceae bacterium]|nr:S9 family peptidase [Phaeodactylibacter sp.]MCB9038909.1 S9 family peptidase [Lewinellaceae bacterium]